MTTGAGAGISIEFRKLKLISFCLKIIKKMNKVVLSIFLICCLVSSARSAQCLLNANVLATLAGCSASSCTLSATLLTTLCLSLGTTTDLAISLPSATSLSISSGTNLNLNSLSVSSTSNATVTLNIASVVTLANDLALGANALVTVAKGSVVTIQGNVNVATSATLQVAGNVTAAGTVTVNGNLRLAGDIVNSAAQTAWITTTNTAKSISVSGSASGAASITGNGGIDANVVLTANVSVSVGNSPGVVYVNGDLSMSSTTTLEIDVNNGNNDLIIIKGRFNRDGILYADFENNYRPNNGQQFVFATHSSDSGDFNIARGNFGDTTFTKVHPKYATLQTSFVYGSAATIALPVILMALCIMGLVF
jgi:hypothetical protein